MQAVILAAGKGLRLKPYTDHAPKGLVPILDKPLLEWTLNSLPRSISRVHIVTGYLGEQIQQHFGDSWQKLPITYSTQDPLNGTATALMTAKGFTDQDFLVLNGDDIYAQPDLEKLAQSPSWAMLCIETTQVLSGAVQISASHDIVGLMPDNSNEKKWLNCGAYKLDPSFFFLPPVTIQTHAGAEYSLPHTLAQEANTTPIRLVPASRWLPIGTPLELAKAEQILHNVLASSSFL